MSNQDLGRLGEKLAKKFLKKQGYKIIAQNYRTKFGEIDLIAKNAGSLVFVEVKTRTTHNFGWPEEAVTALKQKHLANGINSYLLQNKISDQNYRADVISIEIMPDNQPRITHLKNVEIGTDSS